MAFAVALAAVLAYANAIGNAFVLDDTRLILDNPRIRSLAEVPSLFAGSYWDLPGTQALYRPLVLVTYALNYAVGGLSQGGYAAVNIAVHASVSVLLFGLVRAIGGSLAAAGLTGLLFALHPVHAEAVTAISGRPELLAAMFFLLAIRFHLEAANARVRQRWYQALAACSFAAALLSKESAITLLLVLPVMDVLFRDRDANESTVTLKARLLTYLPLGAVALGYVAARAAVLGGIVINKGVIAPLDNPLVPATTLPLGEQLGATTGQAFMTACAVVSEYVRLLVWPARLSPDYSYNQIPLVTTPLDLRFLAGLAAMTACLAGIIVLWRRSPIASFGLAFLALTYSVVSNFAITIGTICAERLMYLPSAGVVIAAAIGLERLSGTGAAQRRGVMIGLGLVLTIGAARTWARNGDWATDLSLWTSAITSAPNSARAQAEYGRALMELAQAQAESGRQAEAERLYSSAREHFEKSLRIYPSYSPPMDGLATILAEHQQYDEALTLYERAVRVWPGSYVSVTNWAGLLWDRSRRLEESANQLRADGRTAEADAATRASDAGFRQALEKVDQAIRMRSSYAHAHLIRALLLDGYVRDTAGAIAEFETVLRLQPDNPQRADIERELSRLRTQPSGPTRSGGPSLEQPQ